MNVKAQIFLCYAREDEKRVEELYQKLSDAGFKLWMDRKNIYPGENWKRAIKRGIRDSDLFLACLSTNSVDKRGVIQEEIKEALKIWQQKLEDDIYLIPLRLEKCEVPESLRDFQWVDLFDEDGWTRLVGALQASLKRLEIVDSDEKRTGKRIDRVLVGEGAVAKKSHFRWWKLLLGTVVVITIVSLIILIEVKFRDESSTSTIDKAKNLIVMITGQFDDYNEVFGAGIIFGVGTNRLYLTTANHLVRRGVHEVQNLKIQLRFLPGELLEAKLLPRSQIDLDLAIILVDSLKERRILIDELPFNRLGDPKSLKRGDQVYIIGFPRGEPWYTPVMPDRISEVVGEQIRFESVFLTVGQSGGGLFNERWELLGMIIMDQPPNGEAISINRILVALRQWDYPVNLKRETIFNLPFLLGTKL